MTTSSPTPKAIEVGQAAITLAINSPTTTPEQCIAKKGVRRSDTTLQLDEQGPTDNDNDNDKG